MKSLFKVTLLATTMSLVLGATQAMAETAEKPAEAPKAAEVVKSTETAKPASEHNFKTEEEKASYALGASFWRYLDRTLQEQEKMDVKLDRKQVLQGFEDAANDKAKLSNEEVEKTLQDFSTKVQKKIQEKQEKEAKDNAAAGAKYAEQFAKEAGVKKTKSGLLYKVEKAGKGEALKDSDTIVVNYKGMLINKTEFDNSYERGEPLTFRLDGMIPGWTEGIKFIQKGGKIKLVIPPELAYGEGGVPGTIPPNSTLIFEVELLDVNPVEEAEETKPVEKKAEAAKPEASAEKKDK